MTTYIGLAVIFFVSFMKNIERFNNGDTGSALGLTVGSVTGAWLIIAIVRVVARKLSDDNARVMFWTTLPVVILVVFASLGQWAAEYNKRMALDSEKYLCDPAKGVDIIPTCTRLINTQRFSGRDAAILLNNRGVIFLNSGQTDRALADIERALYIKPDLVSALYNRGHVKAGLKQWDDAIRDFSRVVELTPKMAAAWSGRCFANVENNQFYTARDDCNRAIELDPTIAAAWANRGLIKLSFNDPQGLRDLEEAVRLEPQNASFVKALSDAKKAAKKD